jgi:hypothetical protein
LIGSASDLPYRMEVRIDQHQCAVVTGRQSPLLEYRGGDPVEEPQLVFEGSDNYYPRTETFFTHRFLHDGLDSKEERALGELPRWARDLNANRGTLGDAPSTALTHEQKPSDFQVKSSGGGSVGADSSLLPSVESRSGSNVNSASDSTKTEAMKTDTMKMDTMKMDSRMGTMGESLSE